MANADLIKIADQQLPLFSSAQMDPALFAQEEAGANPEFTGARLFEHKPETFRAIVALSAEGLGVQRIGKILHVSPNTVLAVRARSPESLDIEKRRLASLSREGARMCVEGILEMLCDPNQVEKMSIKDKGIVFGILAEKSELLSGSPTARLQTVGAPAAVEVIEYMRWLKTEYDRRMGFGEGKEKERAIGPASALDQGEGRGPGMYEDDAETGPCTDQGPSEIVDSGAPGEVDLAVNQAGTPDQAPEGSVGQTPHQSDDMSVNINPKQGAQIDVGIIIPSDLENGKAST